jgi:hypothetical protein
MRIRALIGPVILAALLATTPQLAFGQRGGEESPVVFTLNARPGTEISSDQLGEFLAKNLSVAFGTDMRPLSVSLSMEMISREEGVIGKYESEAVEVEPGKTYPASTWTTQRDRHEAPGFGDRRKITFGRLVVINHEEQYMPRECEDATHALRITLVADGRLFWEPNKPIDFLCLRTDG